MSASEPAAAEPVADEVVWFDLRTLARFLKGESEAIRAVTACRGAFWPGLAFVLLAGIPRDYDGADLLREPHWLVIPVIVSTLAALLFFFSCEVVFTRRHDAPFLARLGQFLSAFWMTGPLAWLYAVPVERFLDEVTAAKANLCLLGLVATWRVLLLSRVVQVLYSGDFKRAFVVVFCVADLLAIAAAIGMPKPVWNIMGGVRLSEAEGFLLDASLIATLVSIVLAIPLLLAVGMIASDRSSGRISGASGLNPQMRIHRNVWRLLMSLLIAGNGLLLWAQPAQQRKTRIESLLKSGRIEQGLDELSRLRPDDLPSHWEIPPRIGFGEREPSPVDVICLAFERPAADWVQRRMLNKLDRFLGSGYFSVWDQLDESSASRLLAVIEQRLPFLDDHRNRWEQIFQRDLSTEPQHGVEIRRRLQRWMKLPPLEEAQVEEMPPGQADDDSSRADR